jgi:NAD(P)-dependent dehydrogenase (short-subunit alcohol dehydrogenase family)
MLASGDEGWIVNTSSGDGGFQPLPMVGLYASAKAAVSCFTEVLANAFADEGTNLHAAVFYPGGNGVLETRLWNSSRNRPAALAREHPHVDQQWDYQATLEHMKQSGHEVKIADLVELGHSVLDAIRENKFIISLTTAESGALMQQRAERIGRGELPTVHREEVFR